MMWVTLGASLVGLSNLLNQVLLGMLFVFFTMYVSGKISPKISALLMKNLAPEVLSRTSNFFRFVVYSIYTSGDGLFFTCSCMEYTVDLDAICWSFLASYSFDSY